MVVYLNKLSKMLLLVLLISIAIIFIETINKSNTVKIEKKNILKTLFVIDSKVIDRGDYYKIIDITNDSSFMYYYIIYSLDGKIIDEQIVNKYVSISIDSNILEVNLNYGTLATKSIFYNLNNANKSEVYQNVLSRDKELIIYQENKDLVIQNVFDKRIYYKNIEIDENLKIIDSVDFESDSEIRVIYYNKDNKEKNKKLSI